MAKRTQEGPPLEYLMRRLAECPPAFLEKPVIKGSGSVSVEAVVSDTIVMLGGAPLDAREAAKLLGVDRAGKKTSRLSVVAVICWLLADPWFAAHSGLEQVARRFLCEGVDQRAYLIPAVSFISDEERREELVRYVLRALGLRPAGESEAQAADRLTSIDTIERERVLREAKEVEERAQKLRAAMQKRAAEAAAAKVTRE